MYRQTLRASLASATGKLGGLARSARQGLTEEQLKALPPQKRYDAKCWEVVRLIEHLNTTAPSTVAAALKQHGILKSVMFDTKASSIKYKV